MQYLCSSDSSCSQKGCLHLSDITLGSLFLFNTNMDPLAFPYDQVPLVPESFSLLLLYVLLHYNILFTPK